MSGDDVSNIERLLTALQSSFDEHLGGAEEREAKRERDHQELVQRVSALERANDGLPAMLAACLEERFPALWQAARAEEQTQLAAHRAELVADIRRTLLLPFRGAQYLGPIIQVIIALFMLWALVSGVFA